MANTTVFGYNVLLKIGTKTIVGTTSNSLDINKKIKESITKDDQGQTRAKAVGNEISLSVENLATIVDVADAATKLGRDEIIALALANDPVTITYSMAGADAYTGSALITSYSEKSGAEDEATVSLNLRVIGAFTIVAG